MTARLQGYRKLYPLLVELQICAAALDNNLAISYKTQHLLAIGSSIPMQNLHVNVYSNFNDNHQKLKVIKTAFNRLMDKQTVVHSYSEILFLNKKKLAIKSRKGMEETDMLIAK